MKKPKILFISFAFYPQMGGIEVNSQILAGNFQSMGYDIRLVTMEKEEGEKTFPYPVFRNPGIAELFRLHKWADIVFENNPSLRLAWPRFFFSSKSIIAIRTQIERKDGGQAIQDRLKQISLNKANAVIAVSKAIRDNFYEKAIVIGNPYRNKLFRILNSHRDDLSFVFLGRLVSEKGVYIAIEAFKKICDELPLSSATPSLKIIGDGYELNSLKEMVRKSQPAGNVTFEGRKDGEELVKLLNTARYILIPSVWEAFGNVALEGMACGCLPFVSDNGGLLDAVGNAGVTFKAGSVEALADAITEILKNPALEASYRENMKTHLEEHYVERVAQKYLDVIEMAYQNRKTVNK